MDERGLHRRTDGLYHSRPLLQHERDVAIEILGVCFGEKYKRAAHIDVGLTFADYQYAPISLIAESRGEYCGFVQAVSAFFHRNTYNIFWLAVMPQFRRMGFGRKLMNDIEQYIITNKFDGSNGSFLLVAEYKPQYYEEQGYAAGLTTYDGFPIMIKHHYVG
jgi:ribosomal protein S18 acetylase RimI-like enzyme